MKKLSMFVMAALAVTALSMSHPRAAEAYVHPFATPGSDCEWSYDDDGNWYASCPTAGGGYYNCVYSPGADPYCGD